MVKKVQLQDVNTGEDIAPVTNIEYVEGAENLASKEDLKQLKSDILGDDLESTFDTLKAVQDWADEHGTEYAELVEEVGKKANKADVLSLEGGTMKNSNLVKNLNAEFLDGYNFTQLAGRLTYGSSSGCDIRLSNSLLNISSTCFVEIKGNSANKKPYYTIIQFNISASGTLSNSVAYNFGQPLTEIKFFKDSGNYHLWVGIEKSSQMCVKGFGYISPTALSYNIVEYAQDKSLPENITNVVEIPAYNTLKEGDALRLVDLPATTATLDTATLPPIAQVGTLILRYNGVVQDLDTYIAPKNEGMPLPISGVEVPMSDSDTTTDNSAKTLDLAAGVVPLANLDTYVGTPNNWLKIYVPSAYLAQYVTRYPTLTRYFVPITGNDGSIPTGFYYYGNTGLYIELDANTEVDNYITLELTGTSYGTGAKKNKPPYFTLISFWYFPPNSTSFQYGMFQHYGAINLAYKGYTSNSEEYSEIKEVTLFKRNGKICVHIPAMGYYEHISVRAFNNSTAQNRYIPVTLMYRAVPTDAEGVTKVKVESSATEDYVDNALENVVYGKEVADETTMPELKTHTIDEVKKALFVDMWNAMCTNSQMTFGRYNEETGYFELNGLTDITYEQAIEIYSVGAVRGGSTGQYVSYRNCTKIRTVLPRKSSGEAVPVPSFMDCSNIEVVPAYYGTVSTYSFYNCSKLRVIGFPDRNDLGLYNLNSSNVNDSNAPFYNCQSLEMVYGTIRGNYNLDVKWSPKLTLENFQWWIKKAVNTVPISIIVHPDVYAKLTDESNTEWYQVNQDAIAKQITFATA